MAYQQGGFPELATKILEQLTHNAVMENRFNDASYYFYQLAMEALKVRHEGGMRGVALVEAEVERREREAFKQERGTGRKGRVDSCEGRLIGHIIKHLFNMGLNVAINPIHQPLFAVLLPH